MNKVACFSVHDFERKNLTIFAQKYGLEITLFEHRLDEITAKLLNDTQAIATFANDNLSDITLRELKSRGVRMISLRSAGYSHLDLKSAKSLGLTIARVPSYSPEAIAEHALALMLCLNRKLIQASRRVRELNFKLDGLEGFTVAGKTIGVVGAGKIGLAFVRMMNGFGCRVLVHDPYVDKSQLTGIYQAELVDMATLCRESDVISLHCPLTEKTRYLIDREQLHLMKPHVILVNTGRGGLIHTQELIQAIKDKRLGGVALDVYEHEEGVFFHDFSAEGIDDDKLARLLTFPNVVVTSHQAFFTHEALTNIAQTSLKNVADYFAGGGAAIEEKNLLLKT
jgi:D-lactate dehydrogenase